MRAKKPREVSESEDLRRAFERAVHTAIEGILDLLRHVISGLALGVAEYYKDYVKMARRGCVIWHSTRSRWLGWRA